MEWFHGIVLINPPLTELDQGLGGATPSFHPFDYGLYIKLYNSVAGIC